MTAQKIKRKKVKRVNWAIFPITRHRMNTTAFIKMWQKLGNRRYCAHTVDLSG